MQIYLEVSILNEEENKSTCKINDHNAKSKEHGTGGREYMKSGSSSLSNVEFHQIKRGLFRMSRG